MVVLDKVICMCFCEIRGCVGISGLEENGYNLVFNCKNRDCCNELCV